MVRQAILLIACLALPFISPACFAETFRFKDGRVIAGSLKNKPEKVVNGKTEIRWAIEIEPGTFVLIDPDELEDKVRKPDPNAVQQYTDKVKAMPETADAHFELGGWCASVGLRDLQEAHYLRALDLDPNHGPANVAAGYHKNDDGRWVKEERVMGGERGKIRFGNGWRFPEAIAIEQADEQRRLKQAAATKDLLRWHTDAIKNSGKRQTLALESLNNISDPLAVGMLTELLQGTKKTAPAAPPPMRILYVNLLSRIKTAAAAQALAHTSIIDPEVQVRSAALDSLTGEMQIPAIPVFVKYLGNNNNAIVNRAADALGQLNAQQTVFDLIEALVTKHKRKVGGGNTNYSPGSMSFGGKEKIEEYFEQNPSVLGSLSQMTGVNFDYNKPQWLAWYASVYAPPAGDLRRDP